MKEKILIELEPGEGGDDAKLLMVDHMCVYVKAAQRSGL